jgi:hypothetical protein
MRQQNAAESSIRQQKRLESNRGLTEQLLDGARQTLNDIRKTSDGI